IDDDLMDEALKVSRLKTKKDAVEEGLKLLVQRKKQENIKDLRGKLHWKGDLEDIRTDEK
ncbi:MAG: type II toxin-antitoxin system VapB family antitoxin, partial [Balneolaceae bacterium]